MKERTGPELIKFFVGEGFKLKSQRGSHIKLQRIVMGRKQTLIIPNHNPIRKGTLREIYNQAISYVPDEILRAYFFTKA